MTNMAPPEFRRYTIDRDGFSLFGYKYSISDGFKNGLFRVQAANYDLNTFSFIQPDGSGFSLSVDWPRKLWGYPEFMVKSGEGDLLAKAKWNGRKRCSISDSTERLLVDILYIKFHWQRLLWEYAIVSREGARVGTIQKELGRSRAIVDIDGSYSDCGVRIIFATALILLAPWDMGHRTYDNGAAECNDLLRLRGSPSAFRGARGRRRRIVCLLRSML